MRSLFWTGKYVPVSQRLLTPKYSLVVLSLSLPQVPGFDSQECREPSEVWDSSSGVSAGCCFWEGRWDSWAQAGDKGEAMQKGIVDSSSLRTTRAQRSTCNVHLLRDTLVVSSWLQACWSCLPGPVCRSVEVSQCQVKPVFGPHHHLIWHWMLHWPFFPDRKGCSVLLKTVAVPYAGLHLSADTPRPLCMGLVDSYSACPNFPAHNLLPHLLFPHLRKSIPSFQLLRQK